MEYISIGDFAKRLGVTVQTLRNWDKSGKLKPHHRSPSGHRYYSESQVKGYFECFSQSDDRFAQD